MIIQFQLSEIVEYNLWTDNEINVLMLLQWHVDF